jgi:rubrerythrin
MSQFSNEIDDNVSVQKLSKAELVEAIRLDIAAEHDGIQRYLSQAVTVGQSLAKTVLLDIANGKRVHLGELERLLEIFTGKEYRTVEEGRTKVDEMAAQLATAEEESNATDLEEVWQEAKESLDQLGL